MLCVLRFSRCSTFTNSILTSNFESLAKRLRRHMKKVRTVEKQILVHPSRQCAGTRIAADSWLLCQNEDNCVSSASLLAWPGPLGLFPFPKLKSTLKEQKFDTIDDIKENSQADLRPKVTYHHKSLGTFWTDYTYVCVCTEKNLNNFLIAVNADYEKKEGKSKIQICNTQYFAVLISRFTLSVTVVNITAGNLSLQIDT